MKKFVFVFAVLFVALVITSGQSFAITGPCSGCHTMHNSQNGTAVASGTVYGDPAYSYLLLGDCLACHTVAINASPNAPHVDAAVASGSITAAGSWAQAGTTDQMQHNLEPLNAAVPFTTFGQTESVNTGLAPGGTFDSANLTCAGANGCHGDPSVPNASATGEEGIRGFHHNSVAGGSGYRFLRVQTGAAGTPVGGFGAGDWEMSGATTTNHNIYQGKAYDAAASNSFSDFCNNCHPDFHATGDAATDQTPSGNSPFVRHPTDRGFANFTFPLANINVNVQYNPFAFAATGGLSTTTMTNYVATDGNARVGCMSCHRSHASDQNDLLRFDYTTQVAGAGTSSVGCLGCHVAQR